MAACMYGNLDIVSKIFNNTTLYEETDTNGLNCFYQQHLIIIQMKYLK